MMKRTGSRARPGQVFQPARGAGGHHHLRLRQLQFIDEVAAQFLGGISSPTFCAWNSTMGRT